VIRHLEYFPKSALGFGLSTHPACVVPFCSIVVCPPPLPAPPPTFIHNHVFSFSLAHYPDFFEPISPLLLGFSLFSSRTLTRAFCSPGLPPLVTPSMNRSGHFPTDAGPPLPLSTVMSQFFFSFRSTFFTYRHTAVCTSRGSYRFQDAR